MNAKEISFSNRMKTFYEVRSQSFLLRKVPVILRLDGRAFRTFTKIKNYKKPFSDELSDLMNKTALRLCKEIQGAKCAYVQSDEISILLSDLDSIEQDAWFEYNIQKMVSVSASIATAEFNGLCGGAANFDCRVFNIPIDDVTNYFIWRQKDWERNSLQMLAQSLYSHEQLNKKGFADLHDMIYAKGMNWNNLADRWKRGVFLTKNIDWYTVCPIFTEDRNIIDRFFEGET